MPNTVLTARKAGVCLTEAEMTPNAAAAIIAPLRVPGITPALQLALARTPALLALHAQAQTVTVSSALLDYLQALLAASRRHPDIRVGLSPRAGLALLAAARAWALLSGRGHVLPEDVQALFVPLAAHRLLSARGAQGDMLARQLLTEVAVD